MDKKARLNRAFCLDKPMTISRQQTLDTPRQTPQKS